MSLIEWASVCAASSQTESKGGKKRKRYKYKQVQAKARPTITRGICTGQSSHPLCFLLLTRRIHLTSSVILSSSRLSYPVPSHHIAHPQHQGIQLSFLFPSPPPTPFTGSFYFALRLLLLLPPSFLPARGFPVPRCQTRESPSAGASPSTDSIQGLRHQHLFPTAFGLLLLGTPHCPSQGKTTPRRFVHEHAVVVVAIALKPPARIPLLFIRRYLRDASPNKAAPVPYSHIVAGALHVKCHRPRQFHQIGFVNWGCAVCEQPFTTVQALRNQYQHRHVCRTTPPSLFPTLCFPTDAWPPSRLIQMW